VIPITDIEDPRLAPNWTGDVRSAAEVEKDFLESPKRVAALLQAIREFRGGIAKDFVLRRAREILDEKPVKLLSPAQVVSECDDRSTPDIF